MSVRLYITGIDFQERTIEMSINVADRYVHNELVDMLKYFKDEPALKSIRFMLKSDKPMRMVVP